MATLDKRQRLIHKHKSLKKFNSEINIYLSNQYRKKQTKKPRM